MSKLIILMVLSMTTAAWGYSKGAPERACGDMTPNHLDYVPQSSPFPYKVSVSADKIKAGEETKIDISGKPFKGINIVQMI